MVPVESDACPIQVPVSAIVLAEGPLGMTEPPCMPPGMDDPLPQAAPASAIRKVSASAGRMLLLPGDIPRLSVKIPGGLARIADTFGVA